MSDAHYFIGVPISSLVQKKLEDMQQQLKQRLEYKVWPAPHDFHITLKFLGGVSNEKVNQLKDELDKNQWLPKFELIINKLGFFGNPNTPRVIFAGVNHHERLIKLQGRVEEISEKVGFEKENRPYRPHITLAKKWGGHNKLNQSIDTLIDISQEEQMLDITEFHLYRIHPSQTPKYEVVCTWTLNEEK